MNMTLLDERNILLYNFLYTENTKNNYEILPIDINNINESDIQLNVGPDSNTLLTQLLTEQLQYLFTINDDIYFKLISNTYPLLIKISMDKKSMNDNLISYVLSELVLNNKSSNILLPIVNLQINLLDIQTILSKISIPSSFEKYISLNKKKIVNLQIREGYFNLTTLRMYINDNTINYKTLLFKIIYTLAIICNKYKYFSHNKLNLDNIFVYINKYFMTKELDKFKMNDTMYYLPNEQYEIKITNFEESNLIKTSIDILRNNNDTETDNSPNDTDSPIDTDTNSLNDNRPLNSDTNRPLNTDKNNPIEIIQTKNNDIIILAKDILKENKNIDLSTKNFLTKLIDMKTDSIILEDMLLDEYFNDLKVNKASPQNTQGRKTSKKSNKKTSKKTSKKTTYTGKRDLSVKINSVLDSDNERILGRQIKIKNLKGGNAKTTVAPYTAEKNDPYRTNEERTTFNKKQEDIPPTRNPPVLLEQTIYDTAQKQSKPQQPPVYIPTYDQNSQSVMFSHGINPLYNQPMQKTYNISLANPLHDFSTVSRVFEDVLPGDPRSFTFTTIYERYQLINFMRNLINDNTDGEKLNVTGGKNSILSSIKLLNLNPYSLNKNPYMDLGTNFMLYNAAYPIRYNQEKNNIHPSKSAHGINVRLYNISLGEQDCNNINKNISFDDFDSLRDIKFYRHVHDKILKNNISPNFTSLILYKIDEESKVNWSKLTDLQHKRKIDNTNIIKRASVLKPTAPLSAIIPFAGHAPTKALNIVNLDDKSVSIYFLYDINKNIFISEWADLQNRLSVNSNIKCKMLDSNDSKHTSILFKFGITNFPAIIFKVNNKRIVYKGELDVNEILIFINKNIITLNSLLDITLSSGKTRVVLTESPHQNIISWASPLYESNGSLQKMIATGYHNANVWKSVLFQIMYILLVLQKEELYLEELSLENNFYIKDLYYDPNNLNYWVYNINGFDYYVPNYGSLVLFDSKYSDLENDEFKIRSSKLFPDKNDKNNNKSDTDLRTNYENIIFEQFKKLFDRAVFSNRLKTQGGLEPEDDVLNLIGQINRDATASPTPTTPSINIIDYFKKHFSFYLNNRIGTDLLRSEKEVINILNRPTFINKTQLIVKQERYDQYKWVLFDSLVGGGNNLRVNIVTKDNMNNIKTEEVNRFDLFNYPVNEILRPNNISEKNIIDTFTIN